MIGLYCFTPDFLSVGLKTLAFAFNFFLSIQGAKVVFKFHIHIVPVKYLSGA